MTNQAHPLHELLLLLSAPEPTFSNAGCQHFQEEIPVFISDELAGLPVDQLYPQIARHLDICEDCLQEYVQLATLTNAALYGEDQL